MTDEQLRELDARVAEARGEKRPADLEFVPSRHEWHGYEQDTYTDGSPARSYSEVIWPRRYTTSIADAMELVEEWRRKNCCVVIDYDHHYVVEVQWQSDPNADHKAVQWWEDRVQVTHLQAPDAEGATALAITLAYARAKGIAVPGEGDDAER